MRKYTQLGLVVITVASIVVLLMYRNEYKQLKYVLDVVNFIGRKDEIALVHFENQTSQQSLHQFDEPLPIWQRIGNGFQAYSSFWMKPNVLRSGGEVITIVASLKHSIVKFKCELRYPDGRTQKGKFVFTREDIATEADANNSNGPTERFIVYKFVCKVANDLSQPHQIIFTDLNTNSKHRMHIRSLQHTKGDELLTMAMCVNLVPRNQTDVDAFLTESNLLQFFLHHQLVGIDEFIVYDSTGISPGLRRTLYLHGIKLNLLPFNFPYDVAQLAKIQKLIQMDCLLRTSNAVKYAVVSTAHDFLYTNGNLLARPQPLLQMLKNPLYGTDVQFDIVGHPICRHPAKKILSDNLILSTNVTIGSNKAVLYKTNYIFTKNSNKASNQNSINSQLQKNLIFYNHYRDCGDVEQAIGGNIIEWRSLISSDFKQYVDQLGITISALLLNEH